MSERAAGLTPMQKALLTIERLQGRLRRLESERVGAIAVVGIGLRTPGGGHDAESFFAGLLDGHDAIRPAPPVARPWWPDGEDAESLPPGGYLDVDIRGFDAGFFGISPREAASIDPQHRLLLECTWEALESAGLAPESLRGARGGVFLGMAGNDYANAQLRSGRADELLHSHFASGTGHSMASGRLSYLLGMHGPSLTVDTACSSSLVAVHLACQSLRGGESEIAIAAGVNLILTAEYTRAFHNARMLAPDGRCKAFSADADGFGRAEGCGVVILKRFEDALRDGDPIMALIRGSAVNQDGPSSGLTAPNGPAQEAVIRAALASARLAPADIGYVEAHGTGTELGDPIEARALGNVFAEERPADNPLLIGSVKSNLGHLEAAAGITGLIKAIETVRRGVVPASLHLGDPNPHIPWEELPLSVVTETTPFPGDESTPRLAGVSSFGFSGTNAHVIVESPPTRVVDDTAAIAERTQLLTLSAADPDALRARAADLAGVLEAEADQSPFADLCFTANAGRARKEHRLAVRSATPADAARLLRGWLNGDEPEGFLRESILSSADPHGLAFLFTGQGAQYAGMGWSLREHSPVVRRVLDDCDDLLRDVIDVPLLRILEPASPDTELINRTDLVQPAIFALQVALAEFWASLGVRPSVVLGHSIGEYAAACLAGVFDLPDALRVVAERGRLMHEVAEAGRMIALTAEEDDVREMIDEAGVPVSIAALNAPGQVVVAGATDAIETLEAVARDARIEVRSLRTSQAFHSPLMDPVVPRMEDFLRTVTLRPADRVRFVSTVTGSVIAPAELADPGYWARQIRLPVRFADAIAATAELTTRGIELGPHPTLAALVGMGTSGLVVHPSLHREQDPWSTLIGTVGDLWTAGASIDWRALEADRTPRIVDLPRYPFQRQPLWVETGPLGRAATDAILAGTETSGEAAREHVALGGDAPAPHPLLGSRIPQPGESVAFAARLGSDRPAFIGEHRVRGTAILPGTAFIEMALEAGRRALGGDVELRDVQLLEPMTFSDGERVVHTRVDPGDGGLEIHSTSDPGIGPWTLHCVGLVTPASAGRETRIDLGAETYSTDRSIDGDAFSDSLAARGYEFGPRLRGVESIRAGDGVAVGIVRLPDACGRDDASYHAHPLLLDAAVQTIGAALTGDAADRAWVPHLIERVVVDTSSLAGRARTLARVEESDAADLRATVTLFDDDGTVLARLEGMRFREMPRNDSAAEGEDSATDPFLEVRWIPVDTDAEGRSALTAEVKRVTTETLAMLAAREDARRYDRFVELLESRATTYVRDAFAQLGWNGRIGQRFDRDELAEQLGIVPSQRRLFDRMLAIAAEERMVEHGAVTGGWRVLQTLSTWEVLDPDEPPPDTDGSRSAELALLDRCGPRLADLLRGIGDPLELLFPAGAEAANDAERMYYDAPFARILNGTIADIVASAAAATHADGRVLRVLEVGGGTAGTSRRILDRLDVDGIPIEYTFTDVSPAFLSRARERWSARNDIEYRTFDLDRDATEQGFATGTWDVVVTANCLHAARDLAAAVARVRGLLRPGGMLLGVEVFAPHRWFDLTVGLTEGWWHFTDRLVRPEYPCIGEAEWERMLTDTGFDQVRAIPLAEAEVSRGYASRSQGLLVARRAADPSRRSHWLLAGRGGLVDALPEELIARGGSVTTVSLKELGVALRVGPAGWAITDSDGWTMTGADQGIDPSESWRGVILSEPASANRSLVPTAVSAAVRSGLEALIEYAGAVGSGEAKADALYIVSRGAQVVTAADVDVDPSGATVLGLARTLERELPDPPLRRLDLSPTPDRGEAATVADWLIDPPAEPELAWRYGRLHARRVTPRATADPAPILSGEYRLTPPASRSLEDLVFTAGERRDPGPGEVEIRVVSSAMNFKDVLNVLGMYPGDAGPLGSECAGVVTAAGRGVDLPPGTPVVAATGHGYGRHVIADARMVAPKPDTMTFSQAAGLPIAYLTAHFALTHLARIGPSDRVLIHAAAGGVGLAALAIAQRAGAEVFATAGSEWKRDLLRAAGVRRVFDSRSPSFAAGIMEATGDQGVTIVLNSLADELIEPTFAVTSPGARFLEIGKRGIWSPDRVEALGKGIEYHVIDWGQTATEDPDLVGRLFADVMRAVEAGDLPPLPVRCFPLDRVSDAFRFMAQGRHAGKLVLEHPVTAWDEPIRVDGDGAWLITGGTGGLGLVTAGWLADRGARELVLVSRSGARPEHEPRIDALRSAGVTVTVVAADVGNPVAVKRLVNEIRRAGVARIRGIVHAAGALSNRTLQQASWSDFEQVLRAKVSGTALLTEAFAADEPEYFVLYSSIASVFGAPGQANHSAANAFEDVFAAALWRVGPAGMSIAWGPWSETGAAASEEILSLTRERGLDALTTAEGTRWLETAFTHPATQLIGARIIDPHALAGSHPSLVKELTKRGKGGATRRDVETDVRSPGHERRPDTRGSGGSRGSGSARRAVPGATGPSGAPSTPASRGFLEIFRETPADARRPLVLNRVRTRIRRVLGLSAGAAVDTQRPLGEIGLDSLLAVELRNVLAEDAGQRLPATLLFDYATPGALADHLLSLLNAKAPPATVAVSVPLATTILDQGAGEMTPASTTIFDGIPATRTHLDTSAMGGVDTGRSGEHPVAEPSGPDDADGDAGRTATADSDTDAPSDAAGPSATNDAASARGESDGRAGRTASPGGTHRTTADAILDDLDSLGDDDIDRLLSEKLKLP